MFKTPNLHSFRVTWFLQPSQFPGGVSVGNEEFLTERFFEDIMDGDTSISLVVEEVHLPITLDHRVGQDVPVGFEVITTEEIAKQLIDIGYQVRPLHPEQMRTKWDDPGMPWGELQRMLAHDISTGELSAFSEALFTDDTDPNAPWYRCRCIKKDDKGWFLALEEV